MKIAKINHERCDSYEECTYVFVPDGTTECQLTEAVSRAQAAYMDFCQEYSKAEHYSHPGYTPNYKSHPNKTVAEIDAAFSEEKKRYEAWKELHSKGYRSFSFYLKAEGFIPFYDYEPELETTADWGHYHGVHIDYSGTSVPDLPGPTRSEEERKTKRTPIPS